MEKNSSRVQFLKLRNRINCVGGGKVDRSSIVGGGGKVDGGSIVCRGDNIQYSVVEECRRVLLVLRVYK